MEEEWRKPCMGSGRGVRWTGEDRDAASKPDKADGEPQVWAVNQPASQREPQVRWVSVQLRSYRKDSFHLRYSSTYNERRCYTRHGCHFTIQSQSSQLLLSSNQRVEVSLRREASGADPRTAPDHITQRRRSTTKPYTAAH
ncbi:hypothetical protein E2C01_050712 [Portunus trituberculatus]|uniref:Uncharacterized protein n=1 Tax=Portunus trituberculatus TaxID=210409 RepID=A0A5B7GHQ5_PORTR|nr:hypothetical protein [Portunus trituberculatus]